VSESDAIELPVGLEESRVFDDLDAVAEFVESERESFAWITANHDWESGHPQNLSSQISQAYSRLDDKLRDAQNASESDRERRMKGVKNDFRLFYQGRGLIYSGSPRGKFIESLREREGDEYAALVYFYMTDVARSNRVEDLRAAFEANKYRLDGAGASKEESEAESLAHLRNEWEKRFNTSLEMVESDADETVQSWEKRFSELESNQEELQQSAEEINEKYDNVLDNARTELDNLTDEYRDQIALLAPVEYWRNKASTHSTWAVVWGILVVLAGFGLGGLFIWQSQSVLVSEGRPNYTELVVLLTYASLGVWGIRILVKLLLSNVRLQRDARERSVMLESFLALLKEGHIDPEEKETILSTLFRPSQDQSVSGDPTPNNAAGIVSKVLSK
jgi:hypothetical protein